MSLAPPASAHETMLVDLTQWLARVMQYSAHHPACTRLGEKVLVGLGRALRETSPLSLGVLKDGITLDGGGAVSHPAVGQRLARQLHERGVLVIRFIEGISLDELTKLIDVLLLPVQTIFDRGGIARVVKDRGITHVQFEQFEHDITTEERDAQLRRKDLRAFFASMLKNLLAERPLGIDVGTHLIQLLDDPKTAVSLLEDDPLGVCDAVAALCSVVRREEELSGVDLFPKLRVILAALSPASHDRVIVGFPTLIGDFRDALGWALRRLSDDELARMIFPSLRRRTGDLDAVFYALGAAVPRDGDRIAVLRRVALQFYDLPVDDAAANELLITAARPAQDFDSYRRERECLAPHAAGALAQRSLLIRRASTDAPRIASAHRSVDARRVTAEVVKMSSRTRRFDRLCTRLPAATDTLAKTAATEAVIGVIYGLKTVKREEWRELAARTLERTCSAELVSRLLADLEAVASNSEGAEVDEAIATIRELVPLNPGAVLERLESCESRKIRRILLDALPRAGAALLPFVRAKLLSDKWFVVRNAVILLPGSGGTARDLLPVVRHPNEKIRMEVVRTLGALPADAGAAELAVYCLEDPLAEVRIRARALVRGELLGPAGIAVLERVAADDTQPEESRHVAARALGKCPDDAAAAALFQLLQPRGLLDRGSIREVAAEALRSSPAPRAAALFEEGLKSSVARVRKACERAAGKS